jgi:hypothetical protein
MPEQIVFVQCHEPGLKAGDYHVHAELSVKNLPATAFAGVEHGVPTLKSYAIDKYLRVSGDRYRLAPNTIASMYPPSGESGEYSRALPHVVLRRPTLPWERVISDAAKHTPWMTVLLLTEDELREQNLDLKRPTSAATKKDHDVDVPCQVLKLSGALWSRLAPTAKELAYLAHVRRVVPDLRIDTPREELEFSLVMGNRMPPEGRSCHAFLVSLEGMEAQLPPVVVKDDVTLTVLHSWRFFAVEQPRSFGKVIQGLDHQVGLSLPHDGTTEASAPLSMGFLPVSHDLRVGGKTWSWYRGPFTPYGTQRLLYKHCGKPAASADGLLFYDPELGMMDVSCASAWTLGRLMALNDTTFATTLYKSKCEKVRGTLERARFQWTFGKLPGVDGLPEASRKEVDTNLSQRIASALIELGGAQRGGLQEWLTSVPPEEVMGIQTLSAAERADRLQEVLTQEDRIVELHGLKLRLGLMQDEGQYEPKPTPDASIARWLADGALLKGLPMHYLVPDERMLPTESIRFFQVDGSWLEAFRDGALSLGCDSETYACHDAAFLPLLSATAGRATAIARPQTRRLLAARNEQAAMLPMSGFLMRSDALVQWPDMEIEGMAGGKKVVTLRQQMIGPILICLFESVVDTVAIHQPAEAVHFGFLAADDSDGNVKKRRDEQGRETSRDPLKVIPFRDVEKKVLDIGGIGGMVRWMAAGSAEKEKAYRSDQFALQMVTGVDRVVFRIKQPSV